MVAACLLVYFLNYRHYYNLFLMHSLYHTKVQKSQQLQGQGKVKKHLSKKTVAVAIRTEAENMKSTILFFKYNSVTITQNF